MPGAFKGKKIVFQDEEEEIDSKSKQTKKDKKNREEKKEKKNKKEENSSSSEKEEEKEEKSTEKKKEGIERIEGEDSSEESSEDDENGKLETSNWENEFLSILPKIRAKDPSIYQSDKRFFSEPQLEEESKEKKEKEKKPIYLKDLTRHILERNPNYEGEIEEDEEPKEEDESIVQQQNRLKQEFIKASSKKQQEEDSDDEFFSVKGKTTEEKEREEEEYNDFAKKLEMKEKAAKENEMQKDELTLLKAFWQADDLDDNEKFLRDFVLNKRWMENDRSQQQEHHDDEDEQAVQDQEKYEYDEMIKRETDFAEKTGYLKFDKWHDHKITTHPRQIEDSLRIDRKQQQKKEKKERQKEKKAAKKKAKTEELKRLKNEKKSEISEKLKELSQITGSSDLMKEFADGNFDLDDWDKKVESYFGDDFYGAEDTEKPTFSDDEGEYNDNEEDEREEKEEEEEEPKKKKKKVQKKEVLDQTRSAIEQYTNLDYEDLIDGTIPCRFKYKTVNADSFGLSTEQILLEDDKELNRLAPFSKVRKIYANPKSSRGRGFQSQYPTGRGGYNNNNNNYNDDRGRGRGGFQRGGNQRGGSQRGGRGGPRDNERGEKRKSSEPYTKQKFDKKR